MSFWLPVVIRNNTSNGPMFKFDTSNDTLQAIFDAFTQFCSTLDIERNDICFAVQTEIDERVIDADHKLDGCHALRLLMLHPSHLKQVMMKMNDEVGLLTFHYYVPFEGLITQFEALPLRRSSSMREHSLNGLQSSSYVNANRSNQDYGVTKSIELDTTTQNCVDNTHLPGRKLKITLRYHPLCYFIQCLWSLVHPGRYSNIDDNDLKQWRLRSMKDFIINVIEYGTYAVDEKDVAMVVSHPTHNHLMLGDFFYESDENNKNRNNHQIGWHCFGGHTLVRNPLCKCWPSCHSISYFLMDQSLIQRRLGALTVESQAASDDNDSNEDDLVDTSHDSNDSDWSSLD